MSEAPLLSLPLRAPETISRPNFQMPSGAWDMHVHIFGPPERYSHVAKPHYTLPDGTLAQYLRLMPQLCIERFVLVQPSYYGTDNSCLLDTLVEVGDLARGVVMIEPDIGDAELDRFDRCGVRAVRLDLFKRAREPLAAIQRYISETATRVGRLGWHLQF